jgi:hypothetical protein
MRTNNTLPLFEFQRRPAFEEYVRKQIVDVDTNLLCDDSLDYWVAVSQGYIPHPELHPDEGQMVNQGHWIIAGKRILPGGEINPYSFYPSRHREQTRQLATKHNIKLHQTKDCWLAVIVEDKKVVSVGYGETDMIAACRCVVDRYKLTL